MTPQEWLVRWMEVKAEYADYPAYFNEEDKQELLALPDELAMRIMLEVKECSASYYIGAGTCPFCIIVRGFDASRFDLVDCSGCSYGKRHGLYGDAFTLSTQLIEVQRKPSVPIGERKR